MLRVLDVVVGEAEGDLFVEEEPREEDDDFYGGDVHGARIACEKGLEVVVVVWNFGKD